MTALMYTVSTIIYQVKLRYTFVTLIFFLCLFQKEP